MSRDVPFAYANASGLSFQLCEDGLCVPLGDDNGRVQLSGTASGGTHVDATLSVGEPGSGPRSSSISLVATNSKGAKLFEVVGTIEWDGEYCHQKPLATEI